jgi:ABC-type nickel/cobalt efflux system permease component RcnA
MRLARALAISAVLLASAFLTGNAVAHPLGNFSINHLSQVEISRDRVDVLYVLDQAEIPTFQERGLDRAELLSRKRAEIDRRLELLVNGRSTALRAAGEPRLTFPQGQGGLKTTRLEIPLAASVSKPLRVELRDQTYDGRVGWKAIVAKPGEGTAVRSTAPSGDPTNGLRSYPKESLSSPLAQREARFAVRPGGGTLEAPRAPGAGETTTSRGSDGLAGVFGDAAAGKGVLLLLLLAAFGWGALHALSPGHGKAMVAAYLIGTRGTARHAVGLGAVVTVTHTIGVFALGLVTLLLSQYIVPEDLYPWLTLISGLLVVIVGIGVLRSRLRRANAHSHSHDPHHEDHHHDHEHEHSSGDDHNHAAAVALLPSGYKIDHSGGEVGHGHHHHHHVPDRVTWKGLIAMGAAAGVLPCPSALVVLLAAIAQHQVALGLLLIVAFSAGLAMTLTGLGLMVVFARRAVSRVSIPSGVTAALPALSAVVIVGVGVGLTLQAIPQVS